MKTLAVILLLFCITSPAAAIDMSTGFTGAVALQECELAAAPNNNMTSMEIVHAAHCLGYVRGFADIFPLIKRGQIACIPESVDASQLSRVFVKFLRNYPERLHQPASLLLADCLFRAFPCQ